MNTQIINGGFKLHRFEVYNWGTFHQQAWSILLDGESSLLTGENGSGKSTLVDGLLTLLVPNKKRNYNLSSGSDKRERNELTYVKGAFGKEQNEFNVGNTKFLRNDEDYSVLLVEFKNEATKQSITLAQFFYIDSSGLRKIYIVSPKPLSIITHFSNITSASEIKAKLKSLGYVHIFLTFSEYEAAFLSFIGIETHSAIDLFNQITSIKEVGKLSVFVRAHMLDRPQMKELMDELFKNFEDLTLSHKAIITAKEQLKELTPLEEMINQYKIIDGQIKQLQDVQKLIPHFFESKKEIFIKEAISQKKLQLENIASLIIQNNSNLKQIENQRSTIEESMHLDKSASALEKIEIQIQNLIEKKSEKEKNLKNYTTLLKPLGLTSPDNMKSFLVHYKTIEKMHNEIKQSSQPLQDQLFEFKTQSKNIQDSTRQLEVEIQSLKNRKNKLPLNYTNIRKQIAEHLSIKEIEIPYVAELIKIKDHQKIWSHAIEKLFGGLSLRLLVPDEYAHKVHKFVTNNKLNIKLVYHNIKNTDNQSTKFSDLNKANEKNDTVIDKIEFRPRMPEFTSWLQNKILHEYNFECVQDLKEYAKSSKAITQEGLIKRSLNQHEKDDRVFSHQLQDSILGWDNSDFLNDLIDNYKNKLIEKDKLDKKAAGINSKLVELEAKNINIFQLLQLKDFTTIDQSSILEQIDSLSEQKSTLSAKNKNLTRLKSNLNDILEQIQSIQKERDSLICQQGILKNELDVLSQALAKIELFPATTHSYQEIESLLKKEKFSLNANNVQEFDLIRYKMAEILDGKVQHAGLRKNGHTTNIIRKMSAFKNQFSEYTTHLDSSLESIDGFLKLKSDIEKQSLPEHEHKFKKLLDKSLVNDMMAFKSTLELSYEKIEDDIKNLNSSLVKIPYSANSYVRLCVTPSKDTEVREFQHMLKHALTSLDKNKGALEESFNRIKKIIDILKTQERYANKVTDVRQWADFYVTENYLETENQKNFYSDSGGLSGGQKVKLAFTILASAIAFQYGLNKANAAQKSFRFVVIDEAFSKSDEINSKYAMQLFKDLGLQLMVVTPKDKIYVVEPFVKNIFLTQMEEKTNNSQLLTFQIDQYEFRHTATA